MPPASRKPQAAPAIGPLPQESAEGALLLLRDAAHCRLQSRSTGMEALMPPAAASSETGLELGAAPLAAAATAAATAGALCTPPNRNQKSIHRKALHSGLLFRASIRGVCASLAG
ncbi:hypothetical protein NDU88_006088 [Pleurodeles waltl]|uniref:Uncharacterized protein n=1 Tax=Pleurodeles waltl TaxID=8319 RepID=A0AAV7TDT9_PLEWA|nr:hypothetical protein NDU88_006088 [Pleurodeles waltl]